ncbi:MAG: hydantoinase B/oxoprolinase family protein [Solirubrobacterales bacterium]
MTDQANALETLGALDPVTFEVIRHRLWALNDDQGRLAARLSGSPIVYEVNDFNTALVAPDGRGLYAGIYIIEHATTIDVFVRKVIAEWPADDIRPGDMFFTNDPWSGALHANDGILIAPFFWEGQIVCWGGIVMHDDDVGSPVPGSFVVGSTDRYGEAPLFPLVRMVENYQLCADIEGVYLRNSRTPELNALNLRARLAALMTTEQRIHDVIRQYGLDAFLATQNGILEYVHTGLRRRLREIPDGTWFDQVYHDHNGNSNEIYPICCRLTKRGDTLTVDFTGTAKQVVGAINCARPAMEGAVMGVFLVDLCYDLPWSVGAARDVVEIVSEEGTINNAVSPAGVSMASVMMTMSTQDVVSNVFAKMLMCSEEYASEAQSVWSAGINVPIYAGVDRRGEPFSQVLMDVFGGGGGARTYTDGIDTGGGFESVSGTMPNVETSESRIPMLQVYKRELRDGSGPGRFRGGVPAEWALVPHKNVGPMVAVTIASGVSQPGADGLAGGGPTPVASSLILRETNVRDLLKGGDIPFTSEEIVADHVDVMQAKDQTTLNEGDAVVSSAKGGCGYGDPTLRDPDLVARDVRSGLVSDEIAQSVYGVVIDAAEVDVTATTAARREIREARLQEGKPAVGGEVQVARLEGGEVLHPVGDTVEAVRVGAEVAIRCTECHQRLSAYDEEYKHGTLVRDLPITATSPLNARGLVDDFVLREFCCPGCGTAVAMNVQLRDEPIRDEVRFFSTAGSV